MSNLFSGSDRINNTQVVSKDEPKQFLKFSVDRSNKLMLPIDRITEVLKIEFGQIVPIPQMPSWVMGVYNWRGDILWMVDLGHLIGFPPWYQRETNRSRQTAIVLSPYKKQAQSNRQVGIDLGLVVSQVEDIEMCQPSSIQSPPNNSVTTQLSPFLQGYWLGAQNKMILVLDGQAIVSAMPRNLSPE